MPSLTGLKSVFPRQSDGFQGPLVLGLVTCAAIWLFLPGFETLFEAWQTPEYSHGPLIPVLSFIMFLRHLREVPERHGPIPDRWPGVLLILVAALFAVVGRLSNIYDFVAYGMILWVGGLLLISFGWRQGVLFWPSVLHLVYMLPLPGTLYYKVSIFLQGISSELGVAMLKIIGVAVTLQGNIIDLGVIQLQVAEACSGLRYLFPILSFSYIFALLYTGPIWHRVVLLLAAAPITVVMNSVRIAVGGWLATQFGLGHLEGFSHFFEGWVIFLLSVGLLFLISRILVIMSGRQYGLDLELTGMGPQMRRVHLLQPSVPMIAAGLVPVLTMLSLGAFVPERRSVTEIDRMPLVLFPMEVGNWWRDSSKLYPEDIERALGADDYHWADYFSPGQPAQVDLFMAWYADQSKGGVHSPEICLPGAGWEISELERVDIGPEIGWSGPFEINRAIIQKGFTRLMVYYWFDQRGRKVAWDFEAKALLLYDGITTGRTDGALVRLTTPLLEGEDPATAEARLRDLMLPMLKSLPQFIPAQ